MISNKVRLTPSSYSRLIERVYPYESNLSFRSIIFEERQRRPFKSFKETSQGEDTVYEREKFESFLTVSQA